MFSAKNPAAKWAGYGNVLETLNILLRVVLVNVLRKKPSRAGYGNVFETLKNPVKSSLSDCSPQKIQPLSGQVMVMFWRH